MRESDDPEILLGELLALIHGDGGHYAAKHGLCKATRDAIKVVLAMRRAIHKAGPVVRVDHFDDVAGF